MSARILLVEDDDQIREVISDYFSAKSQGCITIITAGDGDTGLDLIMNDDFDLIMLDVMLPGIDGSEDDKLYGYELGCDDYITKPFSLAELYAKVNALLKRASGTVSRPELVCGNITLNPVTLNVTACQKDIELAPKEFEILACLMKHPNWVISRDTLLDMIWGNDFYGSPRIVDNHVKKLRSALGGAGSQIKTVISKGYKLTEE